MLAKSMWNSTNTKLQWYSINSSIRISRTYITDVKVISKLQELEQELLVIHWAINHFEPCVYGRQFIVKTDHRPLTYIFSMANPTSNLTRIRLELEEYKFTWSILSVK